MEKILVAFDGSEESKRALADAVKIAKAFDCLLTIIHVAGQTVVGPVISSSAASHSSESQGALLPLPENMRNLMAKETLLSLSQAKEDVERFWHKIDFAIVFGDPAKEIVKEASKGYDLIVIGYRGLRSPILSLGNVAEKVVKSSPCSVLVVK